MNRIENIKGCILSDIGQFKEFKVSGLLLPKDEISRNGVLYDWDSVKDKVKDFEGVTINYNHIIDDAEIPIGKVIKTWIKEEEDDEGKAGMYYEGEINEESKYANSIQKGFLNKVSLQVTADAQKEETTDDGKDYTRAWIKDALEVSIVKVPGFNQTTMEVAIAEAFKIKEGFKNFPMEDFHKGMEIEIKEHPDVDGYAAANLVMDHLNENPGYYDKEEAFKEEQQLYSGDKVTDGHRIGNIIQIKGKQAQVHFTNNTRKWVMLKDLQKESFSESWIFVVDDLRTGKDFTVTAKDEKEAKKILIGQQPSIKNVKDLEIRKKIKNESYTEGNLADELSQRKFGKDFGDLSDLQKKQLGLEEDVREKELGTDDIPTKTMMPKKKESLKEVSYSNVYRWTKSKLQTEKRIKNSNDMERLVKQRFGWDDDIEEAAWEAWEDFNKESFQERVTPDEAKKRWDKMDSNMKVSWLDEINLGTDLKNTKWDKLPHHAKVKIMKNFTNYEKKESWTKKSVYNKNMSKWTNSDGKFIAVNKVTLVGGDTKWAVDSTHKAFGVNSRKFDEKPQAIKYANDFMNRYKKESLSDDQRQKMAKSMYKKSWDELDDKQRQVIMKLIKNVSSKEKLIKKKSMGKFQVYDTEKRKVVFSSDAEYEVDDYIKSESFKVVDIITIMTDKEAKELVEYFCEGKRNIARQDMAMRKFKKSWVALSDSEKKTVDDVLDKQGVSKESFKEDKTNRSDLASIAILLTDVRDGKIKPRDAMLKINKYLK